MELEIEFGRLLGARKELVGHHDCVVGLPARKERGEWVRIQWATP